MATGSGTLPPSADGGPVIAGRILPASLVVLVWTGCGAAASAQTPQGPAPPRPASADVERVLARARQSLGGADRLSAVTSLMVEGTRTRSPGSPYSESDPFGFRLMRPDRYQSMASLYRHTLDGDVFWMNEHAGDIVIDAEIRTVAERATRWSFITNSLLFLVSVPQRMPSEWRYLGPLADDPGGREWIEVTVSGFRSPWSIGFDRASGMPEGFREPGSLGVRVMAMSGYRAVDGILFPFSIEDRTGEHRAVTTISSIKVNTGVDAGEFRRR
jgi:hypothetical protein